MKFILARKQKMTQVYDEKGNVHVVTILSVSPAVVTHVRTPEKDGYEAVQIGSGSKKKHANKAEEGHLRGLGAFECLKEFRFPEAGASYKIGDTIEVGIFESGDDVTVSATSKGKGFQGVVKRHGFHGGRRSHGQKHSEREPGSIGGGGRAGGKVAKGMRMAGRMGGDKVTVSGLSIVSVNSEDNTLLISGAVPGRRGTLVEIIGK